jgi:hypothetical protein
LPVLLAFVVLQVLQPVVLRIRLVAQGLELKPESGPGPELEPVVVQRPL